MPGLGGWWLAKTDYVARALYSGIECGRYFWCPMKRARSTAGFRLKSMLVIISTVSMSGYCSSTVLGRGYNRVDQLAREELQMQSPRKADLVLMRRSPRAAAKLASVAGDQE